MHVRSFIWFPGRRKLISAQVCAEDVLLTLIMKWTPVSAVSLLSLPASCLLTAKQVWIKPNQQEGIQSRHHREWTLHSASLLVSFAHFCCFALAAAAAAALWVRPGDQAPATTSSEATERGEEATGHHCFHSGSRGNENKGTVCTDFMQRTQLTRSTVTALGNYRGIVWGEAN